jgi:AraC-like DNA-binding protein
MNRRLLRARDAMDRAYAEPLNVRVVAAVAHISEAHFIRSFRAAFGETPHRYLQRRRVERSMFLLRETDRSRPRTTASIMDRSWRPTASGWRPRGPSLRRAR